MKNIILIHGIAGYKRESYFEWLKPECEKLGLKVFMPQMPAFFEGGTYQQWREIFEKECVLSKDTIVYAQSLGTQFAVKYIDKDIAAYISCAAARNLLNVRPTQENNASAKNFEHMVPSFLVSEDEYAKFKSLKCPKFSLYSDNDNYFEQANLEEYAKAIGSKPILVKGKGHFSINAGVHELPEALEIIKGLVGK